MSKIQINTNLLWDVGKTFERVQNNVYDLSAKLRNQARSLNILEDILQWSDEKIISEAKQMQKQADRCGLAASYIFKIAENYEAAEKKIVNGLSSLASAIADVSTENAALYEKIVIEDPITYNTTKVKIAESGQVVDSFNGVDAVYVKESSNTGAYCCARYVSNYYRQVYGVGISNMLSGCTPIADSGVISLVQTPKIGDIGYQTNSSGGGHWFIVKAVNADGTYTVIEQNWKWSSGGETYCTVNRKVSYNTTSGLKFYRWSKQ